MNAAVPMPGPLADCSMPVTPPGRPRAKTARVANGAARGYTTSEPEPGRDAAASEPAAGLGRFLSLSAGGMAPC